MIFKIGDRVQLTFAPEGSCDAKVGDVLTITGGLKPRSVKMPDGTTEVYECYCATVDGSKSWGVLPVQIRPIIYHEETVHWMEVPFWHQILGPRKTKP